MEAEVIFTAWTDGCSIYGTLSPDLDQAEPILIDRVGTSSALPNVTYLQIHRG